MNRLTMRPARLLLFIIVAGSTISLSSGCGTAPGSASPAVTAQAGLTATPKPTSSPTPKPSPQLFAVGHTDGQGAYLRRTPQGDRIRPWPDGTLLTLIGGDQIVEGKTWRNVRDPEGNDGWMVVDYLVPQESTPVPSSGASAASPLPTPAITSGTPGTH